MEFTETRLQGAFLIDVNAHSDERGLFARAYCANEFEEAGLEHRLVQANLSINYKAGTLRGMHYQVAPHDEAKLVRCIRGALFDQIVDMRPDSATYLQSVGVELRAENRRAIYIPRGFAHGYQTLTDDTEAFYQVTNFYTPGAEQGLCYDDPALGLAWPVPVSEISAKDTSWPALRVHDTA